MVSIHQDYWPCPTCRVKQTRICGGTILPTNKTSIRDAKTGQCRPE